MGRVIVEIEVINVADLSNAESGRLADDDVRRVYVPNALVDTGTTTLSMPASLLRGLGLRLIATRNARTASGLVTMRIYGGVLLRIDGRECTCDVAELPDGSPTLVGQIPLEALDFLVDPGRQRLVGNPEHNGEHMLDLFSLELVPHQLDFEKAGGLVSAIAQDAKTGQVLMIAWMNAEAFTETVNTRRAVYYSRSRKRLWRKGEESGNVQLVEQIFIDCDNDAVLLKVNQLGGAACHEGFASCFFRELTPSGELLTHGERVFDPKAVYNK